MKKSEGLFYKDGLRFSCKRCSNCCRHEPGYVFLSENDLSNLSNYFNISKSNFLDTYCRTIHVTTIPRISLKEKENYDCIFWEDYKCIVYKARPFQCVSYPFWEPNLISRICWDSLEKTCPGINTGRLHTFRKIKKYIDKRLDESFLTKS